MIKDIIEYKRKQLYQTVGLIGLSSEETIALSEELERFMNFHTRVSSPEADKKAEQAIVHANAIHNILDIATKEKLDLPFEMDEKILEFAEWFRVDLVNTLLQPISEKYGNDAVAYIGEFVPVRCIFPETIQSFSEALRHLNSIFHLNHKSSSYIGEYLPYMDIKNEVMLFCHTPDYPTAFNYGIIQGLAKKFSTSLNIKVIDTYNGGQFKIVG